MSNLQNFNETIEDLEKEVSRLKSASDAYKKLHELITSYEDAIKQFQVNNENLESINNQQSELCNDINDKFVEIASENKEHRLNLAKLLDGKTDIIRKENKDFYIELQETIKIRLEENKIQIENLIESSKRNIKGVFIEELTKNTENIKRQINSEFNKQTKLLLKGQKNVKILLGILGGIIILLNIFMILKPYIL